MFLTKCFQIHPFAFPGLIASLWAFQLTMLKRVLVIIHFGHWNGLIVVVSGSCFVVSCCSVVEVRIDVVVSTACVVELWIDDVSTATVVGFWMGDEVIWATVVRSGLTEKFLTVSNLKGKKHLDSILVVLLLELQLHPLFKNGKKLFKIRKKTLLFHQNDKKIIFPIWEHSQNSCFFSEFLTPPT
jgi:hypothetical protein